MGYGQWVELHIVDSLKDNKKRPITVKNAKALWGKFYDGDKDNEISPTSLDGKSFHTAMDICACGRESSPSGTEGSVDLYENDTQICTVYWSCPYSGANKLEFRAKNSDYELSHGDYHSDGDIGTVKVTIRDADGSS